MKLSVIIPTHNPKKTTIDETIAGLKLQSLDYELWELLIIDNNSSNNFSQNLLLDWHPNHKIIVEKKQGLTFARLKGFESALAEIFVMVDDDNVLSPNYLEEVLKIFNSHSELGAIGGKSLPKFEIVPPAWMNEFYVNLALRDLGESILIDRWKGVYPDISPIGAGMGIRKKALKSYIHKIKKGQTIIKDRTGKSLVSGGDNDIILEIIKSGWEIGYFPKLSLTHLIPKNRLSKKYLSELNKSSNMSWINVLEAHQINPWTRIPKQTVFFRKVKAWFTYKVWLGTANYIKWKGACGVFEALGKNHYK